MATPPVRDLPIFKCSISPEKPLPPFVSGIGAFLNVSEMLHLACAANFLKSKEEENLNGVRMDHFAAIVKTSLLTRVHMTWTEFLFAQQRYPDQILQVRQIEGIPSGANLSLVAQKCPLLTHLDFSCSRRVDDGFLANLAPLFPSLIHLNLKGCYKVSDVGLMALSGLKNLKELNLHSCHRVTNQGVKDLIREISTLTTLQLPTKTRPLP